MSLYLLSRCLKAVPDALLSAALEVLNGGDRPSQAGLTTFSHGCGTPSVRLNYTYERATVSLYGYTFGALVPAVIAETEASQYYLTGSGGSINDSYETTGNFDCDGDGVKEPYTVHRVLSNIRANWSGPLLCDYRTYSSGRVTSVEEECVADEFDNTTYDFSMGGMGFWTTSAAAQSSPTATHTSRSCRYFSPGDFTLTLSGQYTEANAVSDTTFIPVSSPSPVSAGSIALYPDNTFALSTLGVDLGSIWQVRAGSVSSFLYGSAAFTMEARGLMPGAQYRVTALIAQRAAIRSASEGSWFGDWSVYDLPSWTFTATAATTAFLTTPYALTPVQGTERRMIWAGIERL